MRYDARAQAMAPSKDRALCNARDVCVHGNGVAHQARLRRRDFRRIAVAAIVERNHVIAELAQHFVQFDAMAGRPRATVPVQIENDVRADGVQHSFIELLRIGGVDVREIGNDLILDCIEGLIVSIVLLDFRGLLNVALVGRRPK